VPHLQIRVVERSLTADALGGVKAEHLLEKVDGEWIGVRVECLERHAWLYGERANVVLSLCDAGELSILASLAGHIPLEIRHGEECPQRACQGNEGFGSVGRHSYVECR